MPAIKDFTMGNDRYVAQRSINDVVAELVADIVGDTFPRESQDLERLAHACDAAAELFRAAAVAARDIQAK